ncbi:hypothetical protein MNBD_GAMMA17-2059 [hydrothermal vent metagenome]|uniref:FimV N-terminal domain-containing protein n=1 Tax=hydrothermal vent metagenome TaxID=652676 RepID=A0A3B0ZUT1_9ZZZZ
MLPGLMKDMAKILAMLLLLLPVNSFSLGLGEINLHSALNQPLDAEIGLLSVGSTAIEEIVVKLASKQAFDKAGLERPFFLTKLKFTVAKRVNGGVYLKITSHEPVKEPFLDFIIEANWPSGRVLREYTLLLDPPVLVDERPAALDIPLFESELPVDGNLSTQDAPVVVPNTSSVGQVSRFTPRSSTISRSANGEITYGPVKRTDTLWKISSEMRPDRSVTVQQVMIALLNENPDAFENQNINDLKAGYFLRISDPATIAAVSAVEAERIAKLQYDQWVDAKHSSALAAGQRPLGVKRNGSGSGAVGDKAISRLKLVAPDDSVSQSGSGSKLGASDGDVRQELAFALESADVSRQENEELRKRLSALEEQLSSMQRLITLKGDTLSAMQLSPEIVAAAESAANDSVMLPDEAELSIEMGDALQGDTLQNEVAATATAEPKTVPPPVVIPPPTAELTIVDEVLSVVDSVLNGVGSILNIDPLLALGGLALVGLVVGALVIRRRKMAAFEEEMSGVDDYTAPLGSETAAVDENVSDEAVESVLNDVIPDYSNSGGMDVNDDDEIDAIAEADVYLAYRRFDKAEELLSEAVHNEPGRHDIQVKLLEVYAASDKKDAFIEQAESLRASLGSTDNDTWKNVAVMGKKIAPTSMLFNDEVDAVMDSSGVSDELGIDLPDLGGDLDFDELDLSDSDASIDVEPVSESENPFSDVSSDELDDLGGIDEDKLSDTFDFDALDDLDELEASLDSAMDMVTDDDDLQKKEANTLSNNAVSNVAEEALDNELSMDSVAKVDDALGLSEMSDELSFETDNIGEAGSDETVSDDVLEFTGEESSPDEPAELELLESEGVALTDDLTGEDPVAESSAPLLNDELEFEAGLAPSDEPISDELALNDEPSLELDLDTAANKVDEAESIVDSVTNAENDVENDLFTGLGEIGSDASTSDEEWLSDFSDEISSLDDDLGELDDSELFSAEDEVGTKLDLARAYIDMGDNESAKGILDEVVTDGNDDQKKDANELIERLA